MYEYDYDEYLDDIFAFLGIAQFQSDPREFHRKKFELMSCAMRDAQLANGAKLLLIQIANNTYPQQGFYYPKTSTLAADIAVSVQTIRSWTRALVARDYVYVDRQSGPGQTNRYFLNFARCEQWQESQLSALHIGG